jgi:RNA polymerase sigma-70 factor (ECF subfamily)
MGMKSDNELVQLLKEGDEKAFELIFHQFFDGLCLFSKSITKNHDISQEIVEEVFVTVWANCKINPVVTSIKSYLYQSVYNNSLKYVSRQHKKHISMDDPDYLLNNRNVMEPLTPDYPIANLIARELEEKAEEVINSLPGQCRQIYLLNRNEDLKYHEIADRLNVTEGTVKTQMSRAFAKLREELKDYLYLFF